MKKIIGLGLLVLSSISMAQTMPSPLDVLVCQLTNANGETEVKTQIITKLKLVNGINGSHYERDINHINYGSTSFTTQSADKSFELKASTNLMKLTSISLKELKSGKEDSNEAEMIEGQIPELKDNRVSVNSSDFLCEVQKIDMND
jgi:hypothetical protein